MCVGEVIDPGGLEASGGKGFVEAAVAEVSVRDVTVYNVSVMGDRTYVEADPRGPPRGVTVHNAGCNISPQGELTKAQRRKKGAQVQANRTSGRRIADAILDDLGIAPENREKFFSVNGQRRYADGSDLESGMLIEINSGYVSNSGPWKSQVRYL